MKRLNQQEIDQGLKTLSGWKAVGVGTTTEHIEKELKFPDFVSALAFVNRLGDVAEKMGHHPDLFLGWGRVKITLSTHDAGGVTEKDFALARHAEGLLK